MSIQLRGRGSAKTLPIRNPFAETALAYVSACCLAVRYHLAEHLPEDGVIADSDCPCRVCDAGRHALPILADVEYALEDCLGPLSDKLTWLRITGFPVLDSLVEFLRQQFPALSPIERPMRAPVLYQTTRRGRK